MAGVAKKAGSTKARRVREAHGIPLDVPLPDILALAEGGLGVTVLIFEQLGDDIAGAYLCRGDDRLVLLNGSDHVVRLRFTLAHELCHHCFGDDVQPDTRAGLARPGHWMEVRANAFASELLMPGAAVAAWQARRGVERADIYDVVALALEFGVSALAAFYRLWDLGVHMDTAKLKPAIERGDHRAIFEQGEPYIDTLWHDALALPRIPKRFRSSVFFRVARGDLTLAQGAKRLGLPERDLRVALAPLGLLPPA